MKIGKLINLGKYWLAPLESVSDGGFRKLCNQLGAGLTWTELVRASAISRNNRSTLDLIDTFDKAVPTGVQISAKSVNELLSALKKIEDLAFRDIGDEIARPHYKNIIDIQLNLGCPSPDLIRDGYGPALLKRKQRLTDLLMCLKDFRDSSKLSINSVGCKIRLGLNAREMDNRIYMNVIESANIVGVDYLIVHARHAQQKSSDLPDWSKIKEIKQFSSIPIIGNGNIFTAQDAFNMMTETHCDAVLLARAAMQNPWIFKQLHNNLSEIFLPTVEEIDQAQKLYDQWNVDHIQKSTNKKYAEFHQNNFNRLRNAALTNNFSTKFTNPSKTYK